MSPLSVLRRAALLALALAFAAPAFAQGAGPLVSVEWLDSHRADPSVVVLDIRSAIDGGGAKAYAEAHIPGAVHSDYDKGGWRVMRHNVPFMLPSVPACPSWSRPRPSLRS